MDIMGIVICAIVGIGLLWVISTVMEGAGDQKKLAEQQELTAKVTQELADDLL